MEVRVAASILLLRQGVMNPESVDAEWLRAVTGAVGELRGTGTPGEAENERAGCISRAAEFEHRQARLAAMGAIRHDLAGIEASLAGIGAGQQSGGGTGGGSRPAATGGEPAGCAGIRAPRPGWHIRPRDSFPAWPETRTRCHG